MVLLTVGTLGVIAVASCSPLFKDSPFATRILGEINEVDVQTDAVVLIGDPQVTSRESLINDRNREVEHLENMISQSGSVTFEPQLKRDIEVIQSFAAQLGFSFNPTSGTETERNEELASLRNEIEIVKLRAELNRLKNLSQEDPSIGDNAQRGSFPPGQIGSDDAGPPDDASNGEKPSQDITGTAEIKARLQNALTSAETLLNDLIDKETSRAAQTDINPSPEEHFEDLNAYRTRLRHRQNEVRLDDAHDANGHTLYRLQFTATVLPGKIKEKYAVLDMEIKPTKVSEKQISELYENWLVQLAHRHYRFSISYAAGERSLEYYDWMTRSTQLVSSGVVGRFVDRIKLKDSNEEIPIFIYTYPCDNELISSTMKSNPKSYFTTTTKKIESPSVNSVRTFLMLVKDDGGDWRLTPFDVGERLRLIDKRLKPPIDSLGSTFIYNTQKIASARAEPCRVPEEFKKKVTNNGYWAGTARTYQVQPTGRVQRISSIASAANSMQVAFSLAALLPTSGISLDTGFAAAKTAVGMAEAIERTPLVIGYVDRQKIVSDSSKKPVNARFGYIFGPKVVLNTEANQLEYQHPAKSHAVFADITVPAWWESIDLDVHSVWAENWHESTKVLNSSSSDSRQIRVRLRPGISKSNSLTNFILGTNPDKPRITNVYPSKVSACQSPGSNNDIVFTVEGINLWREPRAYLRGQRHKSIRVLPDMGGLEVVFNLANLPVNPDREPEDKITIWTGLGPDSISVDIVNNINGVSCLRVDDPYDSTVSIEPNLPRVIADGNNTNIRIDLLAPLPREARNVKIIYQFLRPDGRLLQVQNLGNDNAREFPAKYVVGTGQVIQPENVDYGTPDADGAPMRVGISFDTIDGGQRQSHFAESKVVYYSNEETSKFRVETATLDSLPGTVDITSPVKFKHGYPKFPQDSTKTKSFVSALEKYPDIKLITLAEWNHDESKVELDVSLKNKKQANQDNFKAIRCKKNESLKMTIQIADEPVLPKVDGANNSVTFSKRNC